MKLHKFVVKLDFNWYYANTALEYRVYRQAFTGAATTTLKGFSPEPDPRQGSSGV